MNSKKYDTNTLFYNKFVCKGVLITSLASIFRNANSKYIKKNLDMLQSNAEAGMPLYHPSRTYQTPVKFDEFADACVLFAELKNLKTDYTLRAEGMTLGIYTNDKEWLQRLDEKIGFSELHTPECIEDIEFLLEHPNVVIVDKPVEWRYKCFLGMKCDPAFRDFYIANKDKIKIGETALQGVDRGYTDGFYFWLKDKRYLSLCMMAGATIKRIVKHVTRNEIR